MVANQIENDRYSMMKKACILIIRSSKRWNGVIRFRMRLSDLRIAYIYIYSIRFFSFQHVGKRIKRHYVKP